MSLSYTKIIKRPSSFSRLFGLTPSQFLLIRDQAYPLWEQALKKQYKRKGRDFKLCFEDMLLLLLLYYRSYITQEFVGYLFGIDDSRVCRLIRRLEPILARVMALKKSKHLSKQDVESLIIDATEQPIERPKKGQKPYYSGKKKRHTLKTEVRVTRKGRIIHVSKTRPGSVHDFALYKQEPPIPTDSRAFVDSGYQGLDNLHPSIDIPYKSSKNKPLDCDEKEYNQALSRIRVKVEHVIAQLKTFRILSDRYRNKRKRYHVKFNIIAGLVNMKNGFHTA